MPAHDNELILHKARAHRAEKDRRQGLTSIPDYYQEMTRITMALTQLLEPLRTRLALVPAAPSPLLPTIVPTIAPRRDPTAQTFSRGEYRVRVLHISDIHFRSDKGTLPPGRADDVKREAWRRHLVVGDRFREEIRQATATAPFDLVCLTGDTADWGLPQEYDEATPFIDSLLIDAGVDRARLFLVPGNHDINRSTNKPAWIKLREATRAVSMRQMSNWIAGGRPPFGVEAALRADVIERQQGYRDWVARIGRPELRPETSPHGLLGYRAQLALGGRPFPVHVIGLDSAWLSGDDSDNGKLLLTEDQIGRLATDQRGRPFAGLRIVLVHHPLSQLADAADARRLLADHVDLVLRGHQHDPLADVWTDPDRRLVELAAGCLYEGDEGNRYPNSYTTIDIITDEHGRPVRHELLFRSWSSRGHWHNDGSLYHSATNGRLVVPGGPPSGMPSLGLVSR